MSIVQFDNVSRVYTAGDHELRALDHVSFTLDEGKFVVILLTFGVSLLVGRMVARKNKKIDMVEALKNAE